MGGASLRLAVALGAATLSAWGAEAQTAQVPPAREFVAAAAQSDHFEIVEGRTALAQSQNPRVRAFAQEMIKDHARTSDALQAAALKAGVDKPPPGMSGDQQKLLVALQSQRGPEFDRTYLKQQAIAHDQALVLQKGYAAQGDNADLRRAAASAVPLIQHHLDMAKRLRNDLGGS